MPSLAAAHVPVPTLVSGHGETVWTQWAVWAAQAAIKLRNVTIYCHHCHSLASVSTGQHTQWFLMAAKCAPSVPVLHTAAWCWCVTLPPDLSPIIQPSNQKSSQSNTNTSVRVFIDELNFCTLLEGDKLQVQWIVNIVHLRILHSNLWSPDGGNTIYLLRGPSFNSLDAGSWPVTRHVTASRDVTCPRHPQHHVSPRVTVSTTPAPSLMYYYLNYSCLITHYTLQHYTLHVTNISCCDIVTSDESSSATAI